MIRISTEEKHSRYLVYTRHGTDRFSSWLKKIGLDKLPHGLKPVDLVDQGWITPTLRIDLPDSYFLSWGNYPFCPAEGSKVPAVPSVIPVPLNVPPIGLPVRLLGESLTQNGPPLTLTTGIAFTTTSVVLLLLQPFPSVKL